LVIEPHHADWAISLQIACAAKEHPRRLLGARELSEHPAVSVVYE
jgi:hypothetical protein